MRHDAAEQVVGPADAERGRLPPRSRCCSERSKRDPDSASRIVEPAGLAALQGSQAAGELHLGHAFVFACVGLLIGHVGNDYAARTRGLVIECMVFGHLECSTLPGSGVPYWFHVRAMFVGRHPLAVSALLGNSAAPIAGLGGDCGHCAAFCATVRAKPNRLYEYPLRCRPARVFKIYKDTTFSMMREAQRRGHRISACEPQHLSWQSGDLVTAAVREITLTGDAELVPRNREPDQGAEGIRRGAHAQGPALRRRVHLRHPPARTGRARRRAGGQQAARRCATIPRSSRSWSSRSSPRRRWSRATPTRCAPSMPSTRTSS